MNTIPNTPSAVHYLPIATTLLSAIFFLVLLQRYRFKGKGTHLLWWAAGVFFYGMGTALEGAVTIFGNSPPLNKAWYIAGAFLGGYPLATGTVYLLAKRSTANILTAMTLPPILFFSILVILSPVNLDEMLPHKPGGAILGWSWIRYCTIPINTYAVIFLIGGAILSAVRFAKTRKLFNRVIGNSLIASGAILPAIGGSMARAGIIEGLYIGEFFGLLLIWAGYAYCVKSAVITDPVSRRVDSVTIPPRSAIATTPVKEPLTDH